MSEAETAAREAAGAFDLSAVAREVRAQRASRGWSHAPTPKELATELSVRATALLEQFEHGNETSDEVRADEERMALVRERLAEAALDLIALSQELEIELDEAIASLLESRRATAGLGA